MDSPSSLPSKKPAGLIAAALLAFNAMFLLVKEYHLDFWWVFSALIVILCYAACRFGGQLVNLLEEDLKSGVYKKVAVGFGSAALLYLIFFAGNILVRAYIPEAGADIQSVYALKEGVLPARILVLMLWVIGPLEELFWRGFVQRQLGFLIGAWRAVFAATIIYALSHVGSFNPMLVLAALVCGLFWGLLYKWRGSIVTNVVSHTVWDVAVFFALPF